MQRRLKQPANDCRDGPGPTLKKATRRGPMRILRLHRKRPENRRGAAAVEFALVGPLFILFVFGLIELGRLMMVQQILCEASCAGSRAAIVNGATVENVRDVVLERLDHSMITVSRESITVDPDPSSAPYGTVITVTISVSFSDVSWLPESNYLESVTLKGTSKMRLETSE